MAIKYPNTCLLRSSNTHTETPPTVTEETVATRTDAETNSSTTKTGVGPMDKTDKDPELSRWDDQLRKSHAASQWYEQSILSQLQKV